MVRGGENPARRFCDLPSRTGRGCVERYDESKSDGESGITALKPSLLACSSKGSLFGIADFP